MSEENYKGYFIEYLNPYRGKVVVTVYKFNKEKTLKGYAPQYDKLITYDCSSMKEASHKAKRFINKREGYTYHQRFLK
jgi:hypothetical protein